MLDFLISITIDLSDSTLCVYSGDTIKTCHNVSVGAVSTETPTGNFQVIRKIKHPIQQDPFTKQISSQKIFGDYAIVLDAKTVHGFNVGIHESNKPNDPSNGCIRDNEIYQYFYNVPLYTKVTIKQ